MQKLFFTIVTILVLSVFSYGQMSKVDSLEADIKKSPNDTTLVQKYNQIAKSVQFNDPEKGLSYCMKGIKLAEDLNYKKGIASLSNTAGICYSLLGNHQKSLEHFQKALKIYTELNDKKSISLSQNNIGIYYYNQGDYSKALDYYLKSLKTDESLNDEKGMLYSYNNVGLVHKDLGNNSLALEYLTKGLNLAKKLNDKEGLSMTYNNIGLVKWQQGKLNEARDMFIKELDIDKELENTIGIAQAYNNIGIIYFDEKNYPLSLDYHLKAVELYKVLNDDNGLALAYSNMASIYEKMNDLQKSEDYAKQSLEISKAIGRKDLQKTSYKILSDVFAKTGNYKNAFTYHQLYTDVKDSMFNTESNNQIAEMSAKYESEKKEQQIKLMEKDTKIQKVVRNSFIAAFALMLALAVVSFISFRNKRKSHEIISEQKTILEEKNKDITDSIKYAKRIQEAILPPGNIVKTLFPDSFILYKPKDIVCGDFYWMDKKGEDHYFAAVDCTGHGVPGAFMSLVGHNHLNQALNERNLLSPGEILNDLNKNVTATLRQTYEESTVRDGMDIALCRLNRQTKKLQFAGANNPLWLVRNMQVKEIKGDKFPIGIFVGEQMKSFTNHEIEVETGDVLYVFSDGYADQFGGKKGKKFMAKNLKELFLSIAQKPMNEQKAILEQQFNNWRGSLEQVDDVCVIGIRI